MKIAMQRLAAVMLLGMGWCATALADPCGMVPPIYLGDGPPIARVGDQQTYVFFKNGVETFVIRPGFSGKIDEFGMLIPFPTPPALRKAPDDIFTHLAAAIDPPEVVVDLRQRLELFNLAGAVPQRAGAAMNMLARDPNSVRVIKEEAVGMYEIAVLDAGSAAALKRWMDDHKYQFPDGMEDVCSDYIELQWCFVAVKTRVGPKSSVNPRPGMRAVNSKMPQGSTFDGNVQAMGFRFEVDKLVVPMRLSAFNDGELRNIVYLLTDGPRRIRSIPEEYVVRQISGEQLARNVTEPLPLRIIGGTGKDIPEWRRKNLARERDPKPKNGYARDLFAGDLLAAGSGRLSHPHEEAEKSLLQIGERMGLRGPRIDQLHLHALAAQRNKELQQGLASLKEMTLTVIDGDFPREVISGQNLVFAQYNMPSRRNRAEFYDAKTKGPSGKREGIRKLGRLQITPPSESSLSRRNAAPWMSLGMVGMLAIVGLLLRGRKKS